MNRPALRAKLRGQVNQAAKRLHELHAMRDWQRMEGGMSDTPICRTTHKRTNECPCMRCNPPKE